MSNLAKCTNVKVNQALGDGQNAMQRFEAFAQTQEISNIFSDWKPPAWLTLYITGFLEEVTGTEVNLL